jgi:hypothetical protein
MTDSYILIYEEHDGHLAYLGTWRGHGKNLVGESLGLSIIKGLGVFTKEATPQDLIGQLEKGGIRRAEFPSGILPSEEQAVVVREAADLVRVVFSESGQIEVRWLTTDSDIERALPRPPNLGEGIAQPDSN